MTEAVVPVASSFRDPSGQVYLRNGQVFRSISPRYKDNYQHLIKSGLYDMLVSQGLLIPHKEAKNFLPSTYKTIKPELVPFITYPYEWSFSQLKDAALATLKIQKTALSYKMSLKDASAYNIQFINNRPVLIDTLSFEIYEAGMPWVAYRQFSMHFLGSLLLMKHSAISLNTSLQTFIDGVPLSMVSKILPKTTFLDRQILTHIHLQSFLEKKYSDKQIKIKENKLRISNSSLLRIIDDLENMIKSLGISRGKGFWQSYYSDNNYSKKAFQHKIVLVTEMLKYTKPKIVWDLGANNGPFSHISAENGALTISLDNDPQVVEDNYLYCKKNSLNSCLPLVIDITNPSPSIGWNNNERTSFLKRGPVDLVMALALVHHLSIASNIPLKLQAELFASSCNYLIIEFIPKSDSQVQRMLFNREDIFIDYTEAYFEKIFSKNFKILKKVKIKESQRTVYLLKNKKILKI